MASVPLKGVHKVTARGRTYHYAWRGGPRIEGEPGSPAFVEALAAAHASRKRGDPKRVAALCARYRASPDWTELAAKTRAAWSPWIDRIQVQFGELRLAQFDRPQIRPIIRQWRDRYRSTPRAADIGLAALSRLLKFAMDEGELLTNPVYGMPRLYQNDRAAVIWTDPDLDQLAGEASEAVMDAARLAALSGLRQGDLLKLRWAHVKANSIEIPTGKSKGRKTTLIPLHTALRAHLKVIAAHNAARHAAAVARAHKAKNPIPLPAATVLTNAGGKPWRTGFGASWNTAVKAAGIDKHFHDLRGTAATRFYLADLSIREIAEIMTWSEAQVQTLIDMYVKRDELLLDRIRRLDLAAAKAAEGEE